MTVEARELYSSSMGPIVSGSRTPFRANAHRARAERSLWRRIGEDQSGGNGTILSDDPADALTVLRYARELVEWECEAGFGSHEKIASLTHGYAATRDAAMAASLLAGFSFKDEVSSLLAEPLGFRR